jgi:hypothetical protein
MSKELHKLDHFRATTSPSYEFPEENHAAVVLPRITSSKKRGKERKEHQKRVDTAVRNEELLLRMQVPAVSGGERMTFPATR